MPIKVISSILFVAVIYCVWRFGEPYVNARSEQDACEFGAVSNARYRELLADARRRQSSDWSPLGGDPTEVSDQLRSRVDDLTAGITSPMERIAAMHATMRASGGYLHGTFAENEEGPFYFPPQARREMVLWGYYFHSNVIGFFDPIDAYSAVHVEWLGNVDPSHRIRQIKRQILPDSIVAMVGRASFLERMSGKAGTSSTFNRHYYLQSCPPIPSDQWLSAYLAWHSDKNVGDDR